ncbi:hypothetical protein [Bradyrhizobium sp. ORS 285]|uniref:hypothetical protein n=1 Tax=Bradyrhizobium sp. ORS 285 TaxID=115808 RepID=UPI0002EBE589|nr:hypothetical protein [Bradyrhizobium sp. ORS 285]
MIIGWIVFVIAIPACLVIGGMAGFSMFYFSASPQYQLHAYDLQASNLVLAVGAFTTAASTIALALKFRAIASALVIVIWSTSLIGTQVARAFVKPGPDTFERHVGDEVFSLPWTYAPASPGSAPPVAVSHENGFTAQVCFANLGGRTDASCGMFQEVRISPDEDGTAGPDLQSWRKRRSEMIQGPDRNGYQTFDLSYTVQPSGIARIQRYYARLNPSGQLARLVVCQAPREILCTHHALVGHYWLGYHADLAAGDEALDARLAGLIESWRRN